MKRLKVYDVSINWLSRHLMHFPFRPLTEIVLINVRNHPVVVRSRPSDIRVIRKKDQKSTISVRLILYISPDVCGMRRFYFIGKCDIISIYI